MAASRTLSQSSRPRRPQRSWRADKSYNEIPLLPPKVDLETKAILKQCIRARAALAELKGAGELIPNQSVLINTLPLLEAQASSEIENIITTTDRLFEFRAADESCSRIKGKPMRVRTVPGTALARNSGEIVYTPPEGEDLLRDLLGNW